MNIGYLKARWTQIHEYRIFKSKVDADTMIYEGCIISINATTQKHRCNTNIDVIPNKPRCYLTKIIDGTL